MKRIVSTLLALAILATPGCAWFQKHVDPAVDAAISCAEQEAKSAGSGVDVIQAADAIVTDIAAAVAEIESGNLAALWAALAPDVEKYGEATVACVWKDLEGSGAPATTGSGSGAQALDAEAPGFDDLDVEALARQMIAFRKWTFR